MKRDFLFALSTLIGLTIGAGIFAIPYSISKSGIIPAIFYFLILGGLVTLFHLFFGEVILRTKEKRRLVGYAEKYLGEKAKILISITTLFGVLGVLLAYLILAGNFLKNIFPFLNLESLHFSLIFWFFMSFFVYFGLRIMGIFEFFSNFLFFFLLFIVFLFSFPKIEISKINLFSLSDLFLPYGIILFSFLAWESIPESAEILKEKKNLKNIILLNTVFCGLIYFLFSISVIGLCGKNTSPDSLTGLTPFLGEKLIAFLSLAALITIADSFLVLGNFLKNTFFLDFKIPKILSFVLTSFLPLFLFLSGLRNFIKIISFVGTFLGLINGLAIILIYKKAKIFGDREPEYSLKFPTPLFFLLIIILILGTISQIYYEIYR